MLLSFATQWMNCVCSQALPYNWGVCSHGSGMFANGAKECSYLVTEGGQWSPVLVLQALHPWVVGIWLFWEMLAAGWFSCISKQMLKTCLELSAPISCPYVLQQQVLQAVCPGNWRPEKAKKINVFSFNAIFIPLEKDFMNGACQQMRFQCLCMGPFHAILMHMCIVSFFFPFSHRCFG